jgi:hypothetical protein
MGPLLQGSYHMPHAFAATQQQKLNVQTTALGKFRYMCWQ